MEQSDPPPLNATNLLDISHALEAVNITQQQRTSLGVGSTDVLGQVLETLKTAFDVDVSDIQSTITQIQSTLLGKGDCSIWVGYYTGTGVATAINRPSIQVDPSTKIIIIYSTDGSNHTWYLDTYYGLFLTNMSFGFIKNTYQNDNMYAEIHFYNGSLNWFASGVPGNEQANLNNSGTQYTYIALG